MTIGRFFLAALVVLLAPGGALLAWLPARNISPAGQRSPGSWWVLSTLADAVALSIAIPAVLALSLFLFGVRVSGAAAAVLYGLCLLLALAGLVARAAGWRRDAGRWAGALLAAIFLGALIAWRLYQARDLALPGWVDSVQHLLIVRKVIEYGGVPPDLTPYLPVPFSYHYGFHLIAALVTVFSGVAAEQSVLWLGQVLNALVAISVYRGAQAFAHAETALPAEAGFFARLQAGLIPRAAPIFAALLAGFVFQMPAYYITWGRYTMLTGLLLLGPTLVTAVEVRDRPGHLPPWILLVLLIAGQGVTHYFILLLTGLFLLVIGLGSVLRGLRDPQNWMVAARLAVLALLGVLLASPWLLRSLRDFSPEARIRVTNPLDQSEAVIKGTAEYRNYLWYLIGPRRNRIVMGMAGVGALAALLQPRLYPLVSWAVLIGLLSLPLAPRVGPFRPDHYSIVLFFPAAMLLAELLVSGALALGRRTRPAAGAAALALAGLLFLAWGLRETRSMINAATILAVPADVAALDWVSEHTPADARFYVNAVIWQGSVYRGVDGGAWLLPYTGRFGLVPPISYSWGAADYVQQINDWASRSSKINGCTQDFWTLARDASLNYVYLRQGKGSLQPDALSGCQGLRQVYSENGVFIYEILPR